MVAGDEVGGGDVRQGPAQGHGVAVGRGPVLVQQVSGEENVVRPVLRHHLQQVPVVLPEEGAVEVAELDDHAPVEPRREPRGGEGEALDLERVVAPVKKSNAEQDEDQKQEDAAEGVAAMSSCHRDASFSWVFRGYGLVYHVFS